MTDYSYASAVPWYNYRSSIKTITINYGVTSVGKYAFSGTKVQTISLPSSVTSIGEHAFDSCTALYKLTAISTKLKEIKAYAFYGCSDLGMYDSTLPDTLETIGDKAFYHCTSTYFDKLTLPASVTSIGDSAFEGCTSLTKVTLSEELQTIGNNCFCCCSQLTDVTIGSKLRSIGSNAFAQTKIKSAVLPDSVTTIGQNAFFYCSDLKTVRIGPGVQTISSHAFEHCSALTDLTLSPGLKTIGESAFYYCSSLTSVLIPDGVTSIGTTAFQYCSSLASVYLPSSLNTLGQNAFSSCSALADLDLPDKISSFSSPTTSFPTATRLYCTADSVTAAKLTASGRPFTALTRNSWAIGGETVYWTYNETTKALRVWGKLTASASSSLTAYSKYPWKAYRTQVITADLGEEIEAVTPYMFDGYSSLVTIRLSGGITSIGNYAFRKCSKLENPVLPPNMQTIGDYAFQNCTKITSLELPDTLTTIGSYGLSGIRVTEIVFPARCNSIGTHALDTCISLKNVLFNNSLTAVPEGLFYACSAMTSIEIPQGITSIGDYAFYNCQSLTTLILPDGITSVGSNSFYYGNGQTQIPPTVRYTSNTTKTTLSNKHYKYWMFDNAAEDGYEDTIIWALNPDGTELTVSGTGAMRDLGFVAWGNITKLTVTGNVTRLGAGLCRNCRSLREIDISGNLFLNHIGDYAFEYCTSLTDLPLVQRTIGYRAFANSGITSIDNSNVQDIGDEAFSGCTNLTSVRLKAKTIGDSAFLYCPITSLSLTTWLESVGDYAFFHATGIFDLTLPETLKSIGANAFPNMQDNDIVFLGSQVETVGNNAFGAPSDAKTFICQADSATEAALIAAGYIVKTANWDTYGYSEYPWYIENGVLYVYGQGTFNFSYFNATPWETKYTQIRKLVVGPSVTGIGTYAFQGLTYVTEVELPAGLTSIGYNAFRNCSNLSELILPDNIRTFRYYPSTFATDGVYNDAFNSATTLYCRENSVTAAALYDVNRSYVPFVDRGTCGGVKWMLLSDGTLQIYGSGSMADYESAAGQPWHQYSDRITSIQIGTGVTRIGDYAFAGLENVTASINLSNSGITSIGDYAFQGMTELTNLRLPTGLTSIEGYAFSGSGVTSLTIPAGVTSVSDSAFYGADALGFFTVSGGTLFTAREGVLYSADMKTLVCYPPQAGAETYTVPSGVETIGAHAFHTRNQRNPDLRRVILPASLNAIGDGAFASDVSGSMLTSLCFAGALPESISTTAFSTRNSIVGYYNFSLAESWADAPADRDQLGKRLQLPGR